MGNRFFQEDSISELGHAQLIEANLPTLSWGKANPRNRILNWSGLSNHISSTILEYTDITSVV